jgi:hypothetical protein
MDTVQKFLTIHLTGLRKRGAGLTKNELYGDKTLYASLLSFLSNLDSTCHNSEAAERDKKQNDMCESLLQWSLTSGKLPINLTIFPPEERPRGGKRSHFWLWRHTLPTRQAAAPRNMCGQVSLSLRDEKEDSVINTVNWTQSSYFPISFKVWAHWNYSGALHLLPSLSIVPPPLWEWLKTFIFHNYSYFRIYNRPLLNR